MAFRRRSGAGWADISFLRRRSGGTWHGIQNAYRRTGGGWIRVWSAYTAPTAYLSHSAVRGDHRGADWTATVGTAHPVTAHAAGGTGSYTYQWERVSGNSGITPNSPNAASTHFTAHNIQGAEIATYRCRVSDGVTTVYTGNVQVTLNYIYDPGGGGVLT